MNRGKRANPVSEIRKVVKLDPRELRRKRVNGFEPSTFTIGNVGARVMQSPAHQAVAPIEVGARSKYAAN